MQMFKEFVAFIQERHSVYLKKTRGDRKPWTKDPILQQYRFCNVFRELDTVTEWIATNWRSDTDPDVWFAMCVARLVNWPDTMQELGYPVPWNPARFVKVLGGRKARGEKVFSGAYIVSTNGHSMDKAAYLAEFVLTPLWKARKNLRPVPTETLAVWHAKLSEFNGMGSFMAAQVVADVKYAANMRSSPDWQSFASSGPGSRRGLNRVVGLPVDNPWKETNWSTELQNLHAFVLMKTERSGLPPLHAQDVQNCLCEFDKYERVRLGEGRPRSRYQGTLTNN